MTKKKLITGLIIIAALAIALMAITSADVLKPEDCYGVTMIYHNASGAMSLRELTPEETGNLIDVLNDADKKQTDYDTKAAMEKLPALHIYFDRYDKSPVEIEVYYDTDPDSAGKNIIIFADSRYYASDDEELTDALDNLFEAQFGSIGEEIPADELDVKIKHNGYSDEYSDGYIRLETMRTEPEVLSAKGEGEYFVHAIAVNKDSKGDSLYIKEIKLLDSEGNSLELPVYLSTKSGPWLYSGENFSEIVSVKRFEEAAAKMHTEEKLPLQVSYSNTWWIYVPVEKIPANMEYTLLVKYEADGRTAAAQFESNMERTFNRAGTHVRFNDISEETRICSSELSPVEAAAYYVEHCAADQQRKQQGQGGTWGKIEDLIITESGIGTTTEDDSALSGYYSFVFTYENMEVFQPAGSLGYPLESGEYEGMLKDGSNFVLTREADGWWHLDEDAYDARLWPNYDVIVKEGYKHYINSFSNIEGLEPKKVIYMNPDSNLDEETLLGQKINLNYQGMWYEEKDIYDLLPLEFDKEGNPDWSSALDVSSQPLVTEFTVKDEDKETGFRYYRIQDWNSLVTYDDGSSGPAVSYWTAWFSETSEGGMKCDYILGME